MTDRVTFGSLGSVSLDSATSHLCSPECPDCFRRRVCWEGHDYTDAMPLTVTIPVGLSVVEKPPLRLFCRRCGDMR